MAETVLPAGYPVNHATASQAVTWEGFKSIEDKEMYQRALLEPAREKSILGQFIDSKTFEANSGSTMTWRKPARIEPRTEILVEGQIPAPNSFGMYEYSATIQEYGDHILYSSKLKDLAIDKLIPVVTNEFSYSFKKFVDLKRIELLSSTKNVYFAGLEPEATASFATLKDYRDALAAGAKIGVVLQDLTTIRSIFLRNNVDENFVVVVPPEVTGYLFTLKKDPNYLTFVEINQGQQKEAIYRGEAGKMLGFTFVETNSIKSYKYGSADFADCFILGKVNGKWGAIETKLEGKGFPEMIHMVPGSAGTLDPFKQKGSIAWKTYYGGFLPYEEAVMKYTVKLGTPTYTPIEEVNRSTVIKQVKFDAEGEKTTIVNVNASGVENANGVVVTASTTTKKKVTKPDTDGNYVVEDDN